MNTPLPHRIRRLRWQARAPTADAAFALRALLRDAAEPVLAALERSLSAHASDARLIHIPRLELHLRLDPAQSGDDLPTRVAEAVAEALGGLAAADTPPDAARPGSPRLPAATLTATPATAAPACLADAPTGAAPVLPLAAALAIDTLWHAAPAELQAAVAAALRQADPAPPDRPVELHLRGQRWTLPLVSLRHLSAQLAAQLATHPAAPPPPPAATASPPPPPDSPPRPAARPPLPPDHQAHAQAGLAQYLHTGSLDWTLAGLPAEHVLQLLRAAALVWARLGNLPDSLFALPVTARPGAIGRWLALLPAATRSALVVALEPARGNARHPLSTALRKLLDALAAHGDEHDHAQVLWLAWVMEAGHDAQTHAAWCKTLLAWLDHALAGRAVSAAWQPVLAQLRQARQPAASRAAGTAPGPSTPAALPDAPEPPQSAGPPPSPLPAFTAHPVAAAPAGLVVPAAGLVLLHPYLPRLLDATGLHPSGSRGAIAEARLPAAAALLHWLASDREAPHEFELGFIKLLLGSHPDTPLLHAPPPLDARQRGEAAALLDAVLGHWQALRGTRVDGLRTSFLQRRGQLHARDDAWLLRIEPEPFDLLLGLLPWGIGLVRLPWMSRPLFTEWNAP